VGHAAATLLCVAAIPVLTLVLVKVLFGVSISAFRPVLSDEITYWHEALTFSRVGFHGGYYTLGEVTNPSGITPFGVHGPGFPILYGLFGAAFGWYRHSVVVLNLLAISIAAWAWTALSGLSSGRLVLSGLLLLTFWPMVFWAPTGMQEALHHAGAIAMAGLFAYMLRSAEQTRGRRLAHAAGWIVLAVLSYIRPSWLILFPAWALVTTRGANRTAKIAAVAGSLIAAAVIMTAYNRTVAPFSTGFFFLKALDLSIGGRAVVDNLSFNLRRTVNVAEYHPLELLHRLQYWGVLVAATVLAVRAVRRDDARESATHLTLVVGVMSTALALMLLLYTLTNWAEQRVLSAFLLFGALLLVAARTRAPLVLAAALVVSNLATSGVFLRGFDDSRREQFVWDRRGVYALQDALSGRVVYRQDQSRWCNTLLASQYPPYLIAVPAGIGISVVREPDQMHLPPRSHYLLLDSLTDFRGALRLEAMATLPYGTLYRNLDSGCP